MKFKYTGGADAITLRHRTFAQGEAVELDDSDERDTALAEKISVLDCFEAVKPGRKPKVAVHGNAG